MYRKYLQSAALVVLGLSVTALVVYFNGTDKIFHLFKFDLLWLISVFISGGLSYILGGIRWGVLVNAVRCCKVTSYFKYAYYHMSAMYSGLFISLLGASFISKPLLLKVKENVSIQSGFVIAIIEKITDLVIIFPTLFFSIYLLDKKIMHYSWLIVVYAASMMLFCCFHKKIFKYITRMFFGIVNFLKKQEIIKKEIKSRPDEVMERIDHIKLPILSIIGLSILRYVSIIIMLYSISRMYGLEISLLAFVIGMPIMMAGMIFSFIPASLGIVEIGWAVILKLVGVGGSDISLFVVANRIWPMVVIIAFCALLTFLKGKEVNNESV